jgi:hypothetical protein
MGATAAIHSAPVPREREAAAQAHQHQESQEERRLREGGEAGLARAAHPLEGGAGVEGRGDREEATESEEVGEEHQVAREGQRRGLLAEGDEQRGQGRAGDGDGGARQEDPGGRAAQHHPLAKELRQVVVGLQERRPAPSGHERLGALDHPEHEGRQRERDGEVDQGREGAHRRPPRTLKSATTTAIRM